jgi:hypothetical protein
MSQVQAIYFPGIARPADFHSQTQFRIFFFRNPAHQFCKLGVGKNGGTLLNYKITRRYARPQSQLTLWLFFGYAQYPVLK